MGGRRILFVHGLDPTTSAKELAREFERIGPVRRCDIPAFSSRSDSIYGFVEMDSSRDADIAYRDLHARRFLNGSIKIQWAKSLRRRDEAVGRRRRSLSPAGRGRRRSMSPPRGRSRSPVRMRSRSRSPSPSMNNNNNNTNEEVNALDWDVNNNGVYNPDEEKKTLPKPAVASSPTTSKEQAEKQEMETEEN